jgi:hypothetical protein
LAQIPHLFDKFLVDSPIILRDEKQTFALRLKSSLRVLIGRLDQVGARLLACRSSYPTKKDREAGRVLAGRCFTLTRRSFVSRVNKVT